MDLFIHPWSKNGAIALTFSSFIPTKFSSFNLFSACIATSKSTCTKTFIPSLVSFRNSSTILLRVFWLHYLIFLGLSCCSCCCFLCRSIVFINICCCEFCWASLHFFFFLSQMQSERMYPFIVFFLCGLWKERHKLINNQM